MKPARPGGRVARGGKSERGSTDRGKAYLFRVVLKWDRQVWRTIEVRGEHTLNHLHLAIQQAFGWDNDHLYAFFMSGKRWDPATEYADPRAEDGRSADEVRIGALRLVPRKRFLYLFDYGDELLHDVWLVCVGPVEPGVKYPRIVKMHGEAPPQYPPYEGEG
jgi:pRiA4b ORF-3-like protein